MKYKMIVSDYDGTMCNTDKIVTERTKKAIKNYIDAGGKFIICSTRPYISIIDIAKEVGLKDEVIVNQGASIRNLSDGSIIYQSLLLDSEVKEIIEFFDDDFSQIFVFSDFNVDIKKYTFFTKMCEHKVKYPFRKPVDTIYNMSKSLEVHQVLIGAYSTKKLAKWKQKAAEHFKDKFSVGLCDKFLINVTKLEATKGLAIKHISDKYGIAKNEIISFGDSDTDALMYEYSGCGVAMGNATDYLKSLATVVCNDTNQDGLAEFIEQNCM